MFITSSTSISDKGVRCIFKIKNFCLWIFKPLNNKISDLQCFEFCEWPFAADKERTALYRAAKNCFDIQIYLFRFYVIAATFHQRVFLVRTTEHEILAWREGAGWETSKCKSYWFCLYRTILNFRETRSIWCLNSALKSVTTPLARFR